MKLIFKGFIGIVIISIIIGYMGGDDPQKEDKKEKISIADKMIDFNKNKESILLKLEEYYNNKKINEGISFANRYASIQDKDLFKIKTKLIVEDLKTIPLKQVSLNYELYNQLVEMNPTNKKFIDKRDKYKKKLDAIEAKEAITKAFYGNKPIQSGWDGSYSEVEQYLNRVMKDPSSLDIDQCTGVYKTGIGWAVHCSYRGKNSFGALVLNSNWFIIRNNRVIATKPSDEYQIK